MENNPSKRSNCEIEEYYNPLIIAKFILFNKSKFVHPFFHLQLDQGFSSKPKIIFSICNPKTSTKTELGSISIISINQIRVQVSSEKLLNEIKPLLELISSKYSQIKRITIEKNFRDF